MNKATDHCFLRYLWTIRIARNPVGIQVQVAFGVGFGTFSWLARVEVGPGEGLEDVDAQPRVVAPSWIASNPSPFGSAYPRSLMGVCFA